MIDLTGDLKQNQIVDQQRAELYMRIFKYAAEDLVNHSDMDTFVKALLRWVESVEERMMQLSQALQTHTHPITPHTHPVPSHVHSIPPHTHIGNMGAPVSPTPLTTLPGTPGSTSPNAVLQSGSPQEPSSLQWQQATQPNSYVNTTGATTNLSGNRITVGTSVIGSTEPHQRRTLIIAEASTPNMPPYLTPNVV